eukprot:753681-Hanusia_phi.AAC.4
MRLGRLLESTNTHFKYHLSFDQRKLPQALRTSQEEGAPSQGLPTTPFLLPCSSGARNSSKHMYHSASEIWPHPHPLPHKDCNNYPIFDIISQEK